MAHNPNPFDFVPITAKALTFSKEEFDAFGDRWSGYLTVQLRTLTPLHIVGAQDGNGSKVSSSSFYRQSGKPVIPASAIKGMLRSFIESITNGWLTQVNEEYEKSKNVRHIGFRLFDEYPDPLKRNRPAVKPAAYAGLKPPASTCRLDVASWLFGYVSTDAECRESSAIRGRVSIEDVIYSPKQLSLNHRLPDIDGSAFMGGGKPSASSWWYFMPQAIRNRRVVIGTKTLNIAEFVGSKLRGRKYYFHQDPQKCMAWYDQEWVKSNTTQKKNKVTGRLDDVKPHYYTYPAECLGKGSSAEFRIYLRDVPLRLLSLLCLCLEPGKMIRHKLGYGKAYGYGSVDFELREAMLRPAKPGDWPEPLNNKLEMLKKSIANGWQEESLAALGLESIINRDALKKLAIILGWTPAENIIFTYPPFSNGNKKHLGFGRPVTFEEASNAVADVIESMKKAGKESGLVMSPQQILMDAVITVGDKKKNINRGEVVASKLSNFENPIKLPIHLPNYQKKSEGWMKISDRQP